MKSFAKLVDALYYLNSNNAKAQLLIEYFKNTSDPDRGLAIGAIAGTLNFEFFKRKTIKDLITERIDPVLFELSYDYVGEMSETVAHLWSQCKRQEDLTFKELPPLRDVVSNFKELKRQDTKLYLSKLLSSMTPTERWALLKLGTRGLRIGVSARFLKKILAQYAQSLGNDVSIEDIERVWHGVTPPYTSLFAWLEGSGPMPDVSKELTFQPVMLAHPFDDSKLDTVNPDKWQVEYKFDGIRAQLVCTEKGSALFSRTGDNISESFPDLLANVDELNIIGRFDGELLALNSSQLDSNKIEFENLSSQDLIQRSEELKQSNLQGKYPMIASFNALQQRLNKKKPSKKLQQEIPVGFVAYDALHINGKDLRDCTLDERSSKLGGYLESLNSEVIMQSHSIIFNDHHELLDIKQRISDDSTGFIEGLMIKKRSGKYISGRPLGQWYKLKRDPKLIDAVIMYAQRGHGKRSSFYSDFTFGCWQGDKLLPIGKAYSGFTDDELKKLDNWVRRNTVGRFGPVKEVEKKLVFEVAFDSVHQSNRHKSKVALRFPRIHRIRWDKPANEADQLQTLKNMI